MTTTILQTYRSCTWPERVCLALALSVIAYVWGIGLLW